jgi:hypothetical protein
MSEENNESKSSSIPSTPKIELDKPKELDHTKLIWTDTTEQLLVRWGDHAACHQWLHFQSHNKFKKTNYSYSLPIIILSTITGTLNVGMNNVVPSEYMNWATIGVGVVNIVTGIITTLQNFFQFAQLSEAHFNSYVGWSKLSRNITIECSIDRKFRKDADRFISQCRADYDRLIEQSPVIPFEIIELFKKQFKKNKELILPDILDNLTHISVYKENFELFKPNPNELPEIREVVLSEWPGKLSQKLDMQLSHTPLGPIEKRTEIEREYETRSKLRKKSFENETNYREKEERIKPLHNNFIYKPPPTLDVPVNVNVNDLIQRFGGRKDSVSKVPEGLKKIEKEEEIKKEDETKIEETKIEETISIVIEEEKKEEEKDDISNLFLGGSGSVVDLNVKPMFNRFSYLKSQNKYFK